MGRVDLAIKRVGSFRRMYAVKRLHPHLATDPEFRQMFLDEARVAGHVRHPNVVGVLDVGEDEQGPFLVMDYVDGVPLGNLMRLAAKHAEPFPVQVAVRIALDVARGLHAAHELTVDGELIGVVHRDLSPQNVMVGFDGQARLTDFGIAKALGQGPQTATGLVKGKTSFPSPEQLRFHGPDRRPDLFSLGVVLFELLSGQRLYRRGEAGLDMRAILEEPAPDIGEIRLDIPDGLVQLLFELLAKERAARPASARDVAERLEAILADLIANQAPTSVSDYVEIVAGEARREQARVLEASIADAERLISQTGGRPKVELPVAPPFYRRPALLALGAAVALALATAIGFAISSARDEGPATASTDIEPATTQPAGAGPAAIEGEPLVRAPSTSGTESDAVLEPESVTELQPEDTPGPTSTALPPASDTSSEEAPDRRPSGRRRRPRGQAAPGGHATPGGEPLPSWVGFDE